MEQEKLRAFLDELTELSHKHGLGITGYPALFVLEADDTERRYSCDDDSQLEFV